MAFLVGEAEVLEGAGRFLGDDFTGEDVPFAGEVLMERMAYETSNNRRSLQDGAHNRHLGLKKSVSFPFGAILEPRVDERRVGCRFSSPLSLWAKF